MKKIQFLLAGESWVSASTHYKGWDFFSSTVFDTGVAFLEKALEGTDIEFIHMPSHIAAREFPLTLDELKKYDVVCLSDIGANTLLLHPDTWLKGATVPNRLRLLAEWAGQGGGLFMCGGYYSYAGIYGAAKYYRSPLEAVLPVDIYTFDDRVETPEGSLTEVVDLRHAVARSMGRDWPRLLGFNELKLKPQAHLVAKVGEHPLLSVMEVGKGRTLAWASDIGPHWCPPEFIEWPGYKQLWCNVVHWLAHRD